MYVTDGPIPVGNAKREKIERGRVVDSHDCPVLTVQGIAVKRSEHEARILALQAKAKREKWWGENPDVEGQEMLFGESNE